MADIQFGVIGNGLRGPLARIAHQPEKGLRVTVVCDIAPANLSNATEWYGNDVTTTGDYRELLADGDIDAVFILTPDYLHEEHACAALEAGKGVYLEKPMAITVEGATRILQTAARTGSTLYVGHNMRHANYVLEMKRLIDRGDIGKVMAIWCRHFVGNGGDFYFRDWHADRRFSNTLLLQKGAHDIDVIHWLGGGYATATQAFGGGFVYANSAHRRVGPAPSPAWSEDDLLTHWPPRELPGVNPVVDVEDLSLVQMQLDNGVLATYDQCHFTPDYWRNFTVIGDEGRLENFGNGEPGTVIRVWNRRSSYEPSGDLRVTVAQGLGGHGGADERCVAEFVGLLRGLEGPTVTSPVAAWHAVATACAASASLRAGGGVERTAELDRATAGLSREAG
ncbi:MAG: oxidoreductase protein [Acidimicrobiaceae bacterium]|nr:oxidoreductase protein [Acidimicrobiaceae bacterium]